LCWPSFDIFYGQDSNSCHIVFRLRYRVPKELSLLLLE